MSRTLLLLIASALLSACASKDESNVAPSATQQIGMVCTTERELGTLIPKRICRTKAQRAAEQADARETLDDIRTSSSRTMSTSEM